MKIGWKMCTYILIRTCAPVLTDNHQNWWPKAARYHLWIIVITCGTGAGSLSSTVSDTAAGNSWLQGDAAKRHLVVKDLLAGSNLLSVNSIDVVDNCLLCGTDAEQICVIRNLAIVWLYLSLQMYLSNTPLITAAGFRGSKSLELMLTLQFNTAYNDLLGISPVFLMLCILSFCSENIKAKSWFWQKKRHNFSEVVALLVGRDIGDTVKHPCLKF